MNRCIKSEIESQLENTLEFKYLRFLSDGSCTDRVIGQEVGEMEEM